MSINDFQFEIDRARAKKASGADLAWEVEAIMYKALLKITQQSQDETAAIIAKTALNERQSIMHKHRNM